MKKDILDQLVRLSGIWSNIHSIENSLSEIKKVVDQAAKEIMRLRKENEELKAK